MLTLARFTFQDLLHDRGRSLLTVLSLAVVVVSYLLLSALSQAYLTFGKQNPQSRNLLLVAADAVDPMESSLAPGILQTAASIAPTQIDATFPSIFRHMRIGDNTMQVDAVPLDNLINDVNLILLQGQWPAGSHQVVMSEGVAQITPWKIGTRVSIYGADFQVTGLVRAGGNKFASLWMTYEQGAALFGSQKGFQIGYLSLAPSADPETVRARLQADPRIAASYAVYLEGTLSDRYNDVNHNMLVLSVIQAAVSLLAITFGAYTAASLSLTERSAEIDLLRLVGFTKAKIRTFLFSRTLLQILVAYTAGLIVAFSVVAYRQAHTPIDIQSAPLVLQLGAPAILLGLFLSITFSFFGVLFTY